MPELDANDQRLQDELNKVSSLVFAYSGGVDRAYLAYAAHRVLGERMLVVTALSAGYPDRNRQEAEACVKRVNLPHELIHTDELSTPAYRANNPDRCYFCEGELVQKPDELAERRGIAAVTYGVSELALNG